MRRALPLALIAVVAAGCGGSHTSLGGAAAYVPSDAEAFISFRTDANWQQFARLVLGRVPAVPKGAHEAAFALEHGNVVVVPRTGTPPAHALAGVAHYRAALRAVPGGSIGIGYVRGDVAAARLRAIPGFVTAIPNALRRGPQPIGGSRPSVGGLRFRWGAAWLTHDGIGARLRSERFTRLDTERMRALERATPGYAPALFDEIPADARSLVDLQLAQSSFELLPKLPAQLTALFTGDRISVAAELDQALLGETALYTRPGGEVTLVTQPADTNAARKAIGQLAAALTTKTPLHVATIGGQLVVSTSQAGIAVFRGGGAKLSTRLELPDRVTSVVYSAGRWTGWTQADGNDPTFTLRFSR